MSKPEGILKRSLVSVATMVAMGSVTANAPENIAVGSSPLNKVQLNAVNITSKMLYDNILGIAVTNNVHAGSPAKTSFTKAEMAGILT